MSKERLVEEGHLSWAKNYGVRCKLYTKKRNILMLSATRESYRQNSILTLTSILSASLLL